MGFVGPFMNFMLLNDRNVKILMKQITISPAAYRCTLGNVSVRLGLQLLHVFSELNKICIKLDKMN